MLAQCGTQHAPQPDPSEDLASGLLGLFHPKADSLGTPQALSHSFEGLLSTVSILVKTSFSSIEMLSFHAKFLKKGWSSKECIL